MQPAIDRRVGGGVDEQGSVRRPVESDDLVAGRVVERQELELPGFDIQQADGAQFVRLARVAAPHLVRVRVVGQVVRERHLAHAAPVDVVHGDGPAVGRPRVGRPAPDAGADLALRPAVAALRQG